MSLAQKKAASLFAASLLFSGASYALENAESPFKQEQDQRALGWGGISLTQSDELRYISLGLIKTRLPVGDDRPLPVSVSTTYYLDGGVDNHAKIAHAMLNTQSGLINIQINVLSGNWREKNDFNADHFNGICAFQSSAEGICQWRIDVGAKVISFENRQGDEDTTSAIYASAGTQIDVPVPGQKNSFQRLTLSGFFNVQYYDKADIYRTYRHSDHVNLEKTVRSVELALDYSFAKHWSIQLSGPVYASKESLKRSGEVTLAYRPF